ncbi:hypothetical protein K2D_38400 [Planctomycetes bacterium K2D]|uniref:Uncharacterized protein n=1 Tax=Botrimarina mediterranea TaxID=2528022 RepID=A0A518KCR2_9BACT|nr:hypothetical protein Spa11_38000 [Botrimarina mediterranea]QDV80215.1 hypothetical protein K2D_38400 [Planctomycetes bacterium K2D]
MGTTFRLFVQADDEVVLARREAGHAEVAVGREFDEVMRAGREERTPVRVEQPRRLEGARGVEPGRFAAWGVGR